MDVRECFIHKCAPNSFKRIETAGFHLAGHFLMNSNQIRNVEITLTNSAACYINIAEYKSDFIEISSNKAKPRLLILKVY